MVVYAGEPYTPPRIPPFWQNFFNKVGKWTFFFFSILFGPMVQYAFKSSSVTKRNNMNCMELLWCASIYSTFWLRSGYILATFWLHSDYILAIFWLHSDYILATFWLHSGYILTIFWLHSCYMLAIFWLHSGYILATADGAYTALWAI